MNRSKFRINVGKSVRLYPAVREETADDTYNVPDSLWRLAKLTEGRGRTSKPDAIELHEVAGDRIISIPMRLIKEHVPRKAGEGVTNADETIALKCTPIISHDGILRFEGTTRSDALLPNAAEGFRMTDGRGVIRISNPKRGGKVEVTFTRLAAGEASKRGKYLVVPPPPPRKNPPVKQIRRAARSLNKVNPSS
jgi:hypothetical protein